MEEQACATHHPCWCTEVLSFLLLQERSQLVFMKWSFFGVLPQQVTSHDLLGTGDGNEKLSMKRSFCCSRFLPSGFGVVGSRFRRCSRDVRSRAHIWGSQRCRTPISCSKAFLCCPVDAVTVSRDRSHFNLQPISLRMNTESWWLLTFPIPFWGYFCCNRLGNHYSDLQ